MSRPPPLSVSPTATTNTGVVSPLRTNMSPGSSRATSRGASDTALSPSSVVVSPTVVGGGPYSRVFSPSSAAAAVGEGESGLDTPNNNNHKHITRQTPQMNTPQEQLELSRTILHRSADTGDSARQAARSTPAPQPAHPPPPFEEPSAESLATPAAIEARRALRSHPKVIAWLDVYWRTFPHKSLGGLGVSKQQYLVQHALMYKALHSSYSPKDMYDQGLTDWARDVWFSSSSEYLDKESYFDALFEVADLWTYTTDADEYIHFLADLYHRTTDLKSWIDPAEGNKMTTKYVWKRLKYVACAQVYSSFQYKGVTSNVWKEAVDVMHLLSDAQDGRSMHPSGQSSLAAQTQAREQGLFKGAQSTAQFRQTDNYYDDDEEEEAAKAANNHVLDPTQILSFLPPPPLDPPIGSFLSPPEHIPAKRQAMFSDPLRELGLAILNTEDDDQNAIRVESVDEVMKRNQSASAKQGKKRMKSPPAKNGSLKSGKKKAAADDDDDDDDPTEEEVERFLSESSAATGVGLPSSGGGRSASLKSLLINHARVVLKQRKRDGIVNLANQFHGVLTQPTPGEPAAEPDQPQPPSAPRTPPSQALLSIEFGQGAQKQRRQSIQQLPPPAIVKRVGLRSPEEVAKRKLEYEAQLKAEEDALLAGEVAATIARAKEISDRAAAEAEAKDRAYLAGELPSTRTIGDQDDLSPVYRGAGHGHSKRFSFLAPTNAQLRRPSFLTQGTKVSLAARRSIIRMATAAPPPMTMVGSPAAAPPTSNSLIDDNARLAKIIPIFRKRANSWPGSEIDTHLTEAASFLFPDRVTPSESHQTTTESTHQKRPKLDADGDVIEDEEDDEGDANNIDSALSSVSLVCRPSSGGRVSSVSSLVHSGARRPPGHSRHSSIARAARASILLSGIGLTNKPPPFLALSTLKEIAPFEEPTGFTARQQTKGYERQEMPGNKKSTRKKDNNGNDEVIPPDVIEEGEEEGEAEKEDKEEEADGGSPSSDDNDDDDGPPSPKREVFDPVLAAKSSAAAAAQREVDDFIRALDRSGRPPVASAAVVRRNSILLQPPKLFEATKLPQPSNHAEHQPDEIDGEEGVITIDPTALDLFDPADAVRFDTRALDDALGYVSDPDESVTGQHAGTSTPTPLGPLAQYRRVDIQRSIALEWQWGKASGKQRLIVALYDSTAEQILALDDKIHAEDDRLTVKKKARKALKSQERAAQKAQQVAAQQAELNKEVSTELSKHLNASALLDPAVDPFAGDDGDGDGAGDDAELLELQRSLELADGWEHQGALWQAKYEKRWKSIVMKFMSIQAAAHAGKEARRELQRMAAAGIPMATVAPDASEEERAQAEKAFWAGLSDIEAQRRLEAQLRRQHDQAIAAPLASAARPAEGDAAAVSVGEGEDGSAIVTAAGDKEKKTKKSKGKKSKKDGVADPPSKIDRRSGVPVGIVVSVDSAPSSGVPPSATQSATHPINQPTPMRSRRASDNNSQQPSMSEEEQILAHAAKKERKAAKKQRKAAKAEKRSRQVILDEDGNTIDTTPGNEVTVSQGKKVKSVSLAPVSVSSQSFPHVDSDSDSSGSSSSAASDVDDRRGRSDPTIPTARVDSADGSSESAALATPLERTRRRRRNRDQRKVESESILASDESSHFNPPPDSEEWTAEEKRIYRENEVALERQKKLLTLHAEGDAAKTEFDWAMKKESIKEEDMIVDLNRLKADAARRKDEAALHAEERRVYLEQRRLERASDAARAKEADDARSKELASLHENEKKSKDARVKELADQKKRDRIGAKRAEKVAASVAAATATKEKKSTKKKMKSTDDNPSEETTEGKKKKKSVAHPTSKAKRSVAQSSKASDPISVDADRLLTDEPLADRIIIPEVTVDESALISSFTPIDPALQVQLDQQEQEARLRAELDQLDDEDQGEDGDGDENEDEGDQDDPDQPQPTQQESTVKPIAIVGAVPSADVSASAAAAAHPQLDSSIRPKSPDDMWYAALTTELPLSSRYDGEASYVDGVVVVGDDGDEVAPRSVDDLFGPDANHDQDDNNDNNNHRTLTDTTNVDGDRARAVSPQLSVYGDEDGMRTPSDSESIVASTHPVRPSNARPNPIAANASKVSKPTGAHLPQASSPGGRKRVLNPKRSSMAAAKQPQTTKPVTAPISASAAVTSSDNQPASRRSSLVLPVSHSSSSSSSSVPAADGHHHARRTITHTATHNAHIKIPTAHNKATTNTSGATKKKLTAHTSVQPTKKGASKNRSSKKKRASSQPGDDDPAPLDQYVPSDDDDSAVDGDEAAWTGASSTTSTPDSIKSRSLTSAIDEVLLASSLAAHTDSQSDAAARHTQPNRDRHDDDDETEHTSANVVNSPQRKLRPSANASVSSSPSQSHSPSPRSRPPADPTHSGHTNDHSFRIVHPGHKHALSTVDELRERMAMGIDHDGVATIIDHPNSTPDTQPHTHTNQETEEHKLTSAHPPQPSSLTPDASLPAGAASFSLSGSTSSVASAGGRVEPPSLHQFSAFDVEDAGPSTESLAAHESGVLRDDSRVTRPVRSAAASKLHHPLRKVPERNKDLILVRPDSPPPHRSLSAPRAALPSGVIHLRSHSDEDRAYLHVQQRLLQVRMENINQRRDLLMQSEQALQNAQSKKSWSVWERQSRVASTLAKRLGAAATRIALLQHEKAILAAELYREVVVQSSEHTRARSNRLHGQRLILHADAESHAAEVEQRRAQIERVRAEADIIRSDRIAQVTMARQAASNAFGHQRVEARALAEAEKAASKEKRWEEFQSRWLNSQRERWQKEVDRFRQLQKRQIAFAQHLSEQRDLKLQLLSPPPVGAAVAVAVAVGEVPDADVNLSIPPQSGSDFDSASDHQEVLVQVPGATTLLRSRTPVKVIKTKLIQVDATEQSEQPPNGSDFSPLSNGVSSFSVFPFSSSPPVDVDVAEWRQPDSDSAPIRKDLQFIFGDDAKLTRQPATLTQTVESERNGYHRQKEDQPNGESSSIDTQKPHEADSDGITAVATDTIDRQTAILAHSDESHPPASLEVSAARTHTDTDTHTPHQQRIIQLMEQARIDAQQARSEAKRQLASCREEKNSSPVPVSSLASFPKKRVAGRLVTSPAPLGLRSPAPQPVEEEEQFFAIKPAPTQIAQTQTQTQAQQLNTRATSMKSSSNRSNGRATALTHAHAHAAHPTAHTRHQAEEAKMQASSDVAHSHISNGDLPSSESPPASSNRTALIDSTHSPSASDSPSLTHAPSATPKVDPPVATPIGNSREFDSVPSDGSSQTAPLIMTPPNLHRHDRDLNHHSNTQHDLSRIELSEQANHQPAHDERRDFDLSGPRRVDLVGSPSSSVSVSDSLPSLFAGSSVEDWLDYIHRDRQARVAHLEAEFESRQRQKNQIIRKQFFTFKRQQAEREAAIKQTLEEQSTHTDTLNMANPPTPTDAINNPGDQPISPYRDAAHLVGHLRASSGVLSAPSSSPVLDAARLGGLTRSQVERIQAGRSELHDIDASTTIVSHAHQPSPHVYRGAHASLLSQSMAHLSSPANCRQHARDEKRARSPKRNKNDEPNRRSAPNSPNRTAEHSSSSRLHSPDRAREDAIQFDSVSTATGLLFHPLHAPAGASGVAPFASLPPPSVVASIDSSVAGSSSAVFFSHPIGGPIRGVNPLAPINLKGTTHANTNKRTKHKQMESKNRTPSRDVHTGSTITTPIHLTRPTLSVSHSAASLVDSAEGRYFVPPLPASSASSPSFDRSASGVLPVSVSRDRWPARHVDSPGPVLPRATVTPKSIAGHPRRHTPTHSRTTSSGGTSTQTTLNDQNTPIFIKRGAHDTVEGKSQSSHLPVYSPPPESFYSRKKKPVVDVAAPPASLSDRPVNPSALPFSIDSLHSRSSSVGGPATATATSARPSKHDTIDAPHTDTTTPRPTGKHIHAHAHAHAYGDRFAHPSLLSSSASAPTLRLASPRHDKESHSSSSQPRRHAPTAIAPINATPRAPTVEVEVAGSAVLTMPTAHSNHVLSHKLPNVGSSSPSASGSVSRSDLPSGHRHRDGVGAGVSPSVGFDSFGDPSQSQSVPVSGAHLPRSLMLTSKSSIPSAHDQPRTMFVVAPNTHTSVAAAVATEHPGTGTPALRSPSVSAPSHAKKTIRDVARSNHDALRHGSGWPRAHDTHTLNITPTPHAHTTDAGDAAENITTQPTGNSVASSAGVGVGVGVGVPVLVGGSDSSSIPGVRLGATVSIPRLLPPPHRPSPVKMMRTPNHAFITNSQQTKQITVVAITKIGQT